ncbi:hypothetical protein PENARI_c003G04824 [Penicillium arizonense]|uniref:Tyrosine specific protein phosphatases domain-containing protein n=1 Tax=Penicillium arizonense TaxID=1835702 RepID=A0A1F5LTZ3_PENAI|nr:hypothetical protein PENARI_c003G04824 [Penicillium arizonense]OGE56653.1 hypothetical protein PENARI_c003G04824 [Penicillium arizonense]
MPTSNSYREVPMSQMDQSHYIRTQEYTSTPRYPSTSSPALSNFYGSSGAGETDTVIVDTKSLDRSTHEFAEGEFVCTNFFNRVNLGGFTRRFNSLQWSYEMRRQAQSILPFLSLGPSSCLRDRDYIRSQGFTLLLAIRNKHSAQARLVSGDKAAAEVGIMADTIDVLDNQELISAFPRAIRRINDHLAGTDTDPNSMASEDHHKRKVLVFCESGNERSAGVVIAYIMVMLNVDVVEAIHMIQQRRFCSSIEDPMKRILEAFGSILSAKRDVERSRHVAAPRGAATLAPPSPPQVLTKKRSFQDHRDDGLALGDGEMDVDQEDAWFSERKPNAPFQDRIV